MSCSKEHVVLPSLIHWETASICYLGLLRVSLRQKFQNGPSIYFLLLNNFTHNKYKKEQCHEQYISSFDIYNYKTKLLVPQVVIDWRLCKIQVVDNWVPGEYIFDLYQVFLISLCSLFGGGRKGGRGRTRKKKRERLISSWGTTIKSPCQLVYLPKALLPNTITLGTKGGHNSIHRSYADLFLNQDRPSFVSLFYSIFIFFWSILGARWTFHKMYIMNIWGKIIGCEKLLFCSQ